MSAGSAPWLPRQGTRYGRIELYAVHWKRTLALAGAFCAGIQSGQNVTWLLLLSTVLATVALVMPAVALLLWAQKAFPIEPAQPPAALRVDFELAALNIVPKLVLGPLLGACAALIVRAAGGGLIPLRADGWWFVVALGAYILATDVVAYFIHRAQHRVPILWAMHSLHHSAEALTLVTGARHFWIEQLLLTAFFPVVAILFRTPDMVVLVAAAFYFLFDACVHVNIRVPFRAFSLVVNNPQFHRIHHSVRPEHTNKNFCKLLPLLDILFGTLHRPAPDDFPATGLAGGMKPSGWRDGLMWPLRYLPGRVPSRSGT
jgi:sterol desaturase/sphingolipid hydroxylase (fatty acid hydroxylase superfamily)